MSYSLRAIGGMEPGIDTLLILREMASPASSKLKQLIVSLGEDHYRCIRGKDILPAMSLSLLNVPQMAAASRTSQ